MLGAGKKPSIAAAKARRKLTVFVSYNQGDMNVADRLGSLLEEANCNVGKYALDIGS